jgi:surface polysaccharide O-acyltransferase-like enzyme
MEDLFIKQINKFDEIDYLRGFAILAVIAIHTSANFTNIKDINLLLIVNVIVDVFSHFAVPLFIFISGFVLSLKYKGLFSQKAFYKKRAKSVIPQYIIFSTIYILLNIAISSINGNLKFLSITKIMFYFLTASSYYHLWFFALIIQFYIFYPYIIKSYEKFASDGRTFFFIFFALITQQVWLIIKAATITYFTSNTYSNSITYFNEILNLLLTRVFFSYIFYFIIGIYVCQNYEDVLDKVFNAKKWILLTLIVFTVIISALWINGIAKYGSFYNVSQSYSIYYDLLNSIYYPFIFSLFLIISLNLLKNKNKYLNYSKNISLLGRYSFGIYLIHPLYMTMIITIFSHFGVDFNLFIFYPTLFILTLLLSYFSVYLISHLSYSEILIGIKKAEAKSLR